MTPTEAWTTHADGVLGEASVEDLQKIYIALHKRRRAIGLGIDRSLLTVPTTTLDLRRAIRGLVEQIAARSHTATCACHLCLGTVVAQRIEQEDSKE